MSSTNNVFIRSRRLACLCHGAPPPPLRHLFLSLREHGSGALRAAECCRCRDPPRCRWGTRGAARHGWAYRRCRDPTDAGQRPHVVEVPIRTGGPCCCRCCSNGPGGGGGGGAGLKWDGGGGSAAGGVCVVVSSD
jgi:hypothetical protein